LQNKYGVGATKRESTLQGLLSDHSIILVSNRSPIEIRRNAAGDLEERRGGGGLVSAMTAVSEASHATWIAAAISDEERHIAKENKLIDVSRDDRDYRIKYIDIPAGAYDLYYNTISNPLLWFVFHYLWDLTNSPNIGPEVHRAWVDGYVVANKLFAEAAVSESIKHDNPVIMIQDYHLFLAAKYIRELTSAPFLFHFTHIPWPEPNYMSVLPKSIRTDILKGMLANDIVGFQSRNYASNFLLCCESLLGCKVDWTEKIVTFEGRTIFVKAYPISIDYEGLEEESNKPEVRSIENQILEAGKDMKLIVRTDRSDPSKNIIRGFMAFDLMLARHPELKEKVKFIALLYPTRDNIKEYQEYQRKIMITVHDINERYQTENWSPIHLRIKDNYTESLAALNCYDVLLVNPVFDGMNLVAKEGPVVNKRDGVLVLSENAGAVSELSNGALIINPFDVDDTASALYRAVTMSKSERKTRATNLHEVVEQNNSVKWLYYQLKDIVELSKVES
jgi:trehalose 6-phosphate synthase